MTMQGDDGGYREGVDPLGNKTADERTFVGFGANPVWVGTRKEKRALVDSPDFHKVYQQWRMFHVGMPLQTSDPDYLDVICDIEWIYRNHFSADARQIENTAKAAAYLKAGFRLRER
jgi:hypothetical protein